MKKKLIVSVIILFSMSIVFVVKSDARYVEVVKLFFELNEKERNAMNALLDLIYEQDNQIIELQKDVIELKSQIRSLQLEDEFIKSMINSKKK